MDNIIREGEQALEGEGGNNQGNIGGGNMNQQGQGNMDQQSQGNMGGGSNNQQSEGNQSSGGGGGFMSGLEKTGKDAMIDQEINQFATKEGVPSAVDGVLDQMVNKEL